MIVKRTFWKSEFSIHKCDIYIYFSLIKDYKILIDFNLQVIFFYILFHLVTTKIIHQSSSIHY